MSEQRTDSYHPRRRQVLPVPGDRSPDGLAEVVPQVPPIRDLDRGRRALPAAV